MGEYSKHYYEDKSPRANQKAAYSSFTLNEEGKQPAGWPQRPGMDREKRIVEKDDYLPKNQVNMNVKRENLSEQIREWDKYKYREKGPEANAKKFANKPNTRESI